MQKKTRFRSPLLDAFVTVVCLSISAFFVFLFWKDLNSTAKRTDRDDIATITFKNKIAQRKFDDRVVWERLSQSSPLYNGDLIRTADLSEAIITFNDGSILDLYENTMIQVYFSDTEGIKVSVGGGAVQLDSSVSSNAAIELADGSVVSVAAGSSLGATSSAEGKSSSVQVKAGRANVTSGNGKVSSVESGETVSVSESGEVQKKPITVTSLPKETRLLDVKSSDSDGKVPVRIEWNTAKDLEKSDVVVQVSKKKDFSEIYSEKVVSGKNAENVELESGSFYWRVYPEKKLEDAVFGKVMVEAVPEITPVSPIENTAFTFREEKASVSFRWNGNTYASFYNLKVSRTADMKNPVCDLKVTQNSAKVELPDYGRWWWSVTPYYTLNSIGYGESTKAIPFSATKLDEVRPPLLASPSSEARISYKETPSVNFLWKSDVPNADYILELSRSKDFSSLIYSSETTSLKETVSFTPEEGFNFPLDKTTLWWRVKRISEDDELSGSATSGARPFMLEKYVPGENRLLYPPVGFSVEKGKLSAVNFMWKKADEYKDVPSVIQISSKKDFSRVEKEVSLENAGLQNLSLSDGRWWWRVGTQLEDGSKIAFSEARDFSVITELLPPVFTTRENQEFLSYRLSPVRVSWKAEPGADYYNARVFDKDGKLVTEKPAVKGTFAEFALPPANYTVRVSSVASETERSSMRTSGFVSLPFSVREPIPLVLSSPSQSVSIDGLTAVRKPVVFTWEEGLDKASSYKLILKKRQAGGAMKTVWTTEATKRTASVDRLPSGTYVWQVVASTPSGFPLDSAERAFTVTEIPLLSKPVISEPEMNLLMDAKYLRKHRTLRFEWNDVPGANAYNFTLYKKGEDGKNVAVWSEKKVRSNFVRLKNLSILDTGDFVWNVSAYSYAKDGFEEQHSNITEGAFKIQFAPPSKIEASSPGIMYSE